jgi:CheY-like chemotaxis protein
MRAVLVVDDEFGVAEVLQAILEDEGYRVVTAINGKQGMARLAEGPPDIVLLDFMMPIMDGAAMLAAMKADPDYAPIPVVMMSSLSEDVIAESATGYVGFIRKPFLMKQVVETIARLLPGGREG